jgi:pimeloyl-ACP methyl ester carboxylesterase
MSYDLHGLSSFVNEFITNIGLKRFILCGFSFGGLVAADYAYWYPERIKKLYMLNCVPRFLAPEMLDKLLIRLGPHRIPRFIYSVVVSIRTSKLGKALLPKSSRFEKTIKNITNQPFAILGTVYEVIWHNIVGGTWSERVKKFNKMPMKKAVVLFKDDKIISYEKYANKLKKSGVNTITFDKGGHAETKHYWENLKTLF